MKRWGLHRIRDSFSARLRVYVVGFTALLFVVAFYVFFRFSYGFIRDEAVHRAEALLDNTILRIDGVLDAVETAAAILYPVAYQTALVMDVNPLTFCIGLLISVSLCFASPIGSPTHMLVYGPGGYRFSDFMRVGIIMNVIMLIATLVFTPMIFPLIKNNYVESNTYR